VDAALDDLFAIKGLLLLEQVVIRGDGQTADVQGVRAISGPGDADCHNKLESMYWVRVGTLSHDPVDVQFEVMCFDEFEGSALPGGITPAASAAMTAGER